MMRRGYALALTAALVLLALISVAVAQSRRQPVVPPSQQLIRALNEGRYDEVAGLAEKLDAQDPTIAALVARAAIARGRYGDAEARLRPVVERAPTSDAALELGLLLKMLGRAEATPMLTRVAAVAETANNAAELARGARALRALDRAQEANSAYRDAMAAAQINPAIDTAWGELFLEKYRKAEAMRSFQAALRDDPRWEPALLGSAQALSDEDPPQAIALARKALEINPSNTATHVFLAQQAADAGRRDEARASLQKALDVNPSSLEAHALLAGLAYVEDKQTEYEAAVAKALAIAPNYGEIFRVTAELASHSFRYDEAAVLIRRAVELDGNNPHYLGDLGLHLLRVGDEPAARQALEAAFKRDPFDVVTYNLLQMMDTLDTFVTVRDGDFVFRMDKAEAPVLQEYAVPLAQRAVSTLSKKYQFTPRGPLLIEIFPKHDDFAVRIAGLPGMIGALGVCFGRVIAMDSPRAQPGSFQWEATLWHELTHVITMQMSNHRVPRWLTEGISVYEEKLERRDWARGMDMVFAGMLNRGEVLKLRDLNAAFTDPKTISLAYYQASLVVEHIVNTHGDAGLHKLLRAYGEGLDTDAALKAALGTDFDSMQAGFDQTLDRSFGKLRAALELPDKSLQLAKMSREELQALAQQHPDSYQVQLVYATALRKEDRHDEALPVLERAAALAPMATGADSPNAQIAEIALENKDNARAIAALQSLMAWDFDNVEIARQLAGLMRDNDITDAARLQPVYQRIVAVDPFDADAHGALGRIAMQANQPEVAVREFKAVVALGPVDQAAAHTDLAESYLQSGKRVEARRQTLAALEIAPSYERAQDLLLKLAESRP
ncbi:MAG: tetratricopeptide repeat protein [Luteitalea sp.]|nr:tetratricopeptide repeat protein [Luteitalea sp.]